jgi:vacuolar iron transporter family protein
LANLFASGLASGITNHLSCKSQLKFSARERAREAWEVEHLPEGERSELLAIYLAKGYSKEDAAQLVEIQTHDAGRWPDEMMMHELGLLDDRRRPVLAGLALGAAKVRVTEGNWLASGLEMLFVDGLAAMVAYGVGSLAGILLPHAAS